MKNEDETEPFLSSRLRQYTVHSREAPVVNRCRRIERKDLPVLRGEA